MPCDSIIVNRIEVGAMHAGLLDRALADLGATAITRRGESVSFTLNGTRCQIAAGTLTARGYEENSGELADLVKRAYSAQVVKYTAQKHGWKVKQTGRFQYQVTR